MKKSLTCQWEYIQALSSDLESEQSKLYKIEKSWIDKARINWLSKHNLLPDKDANTPPQPPAQGGGEPIKTDGSTQALISLF